jgi:adenylate cyclase
MAVQAALDATTLFWTAEQEAERLHAVVRTVVVGTFWGLLLLSGEGHHHNTIAFAALIAYSGLTALTWVAVLRHWRDARLTVVMVTLDVALVVVQVWLIALSAGLPIRHLFLSPPATIIYLVVAQNALRFQPTPVLLGGLAAAILLAAAGFIPLVPSDVSSTAAMSLYWPSLPIVTLVLMTMVLWFQARRTRALVDRAVTYAVRAGNFARFFSPTVARCLAMNGTGNGRLGERCQIAVLFADIRGFTSMAEHLLPEELGEFLTEFRTRAATCTFACDGTVDKFLGDGVLAVFGAPEQNPGAASCALQCATRLHDAMRAWTAERAMRGEPEVRVSIGAHFGEAFVGILGASPMLEFTAIGDTVNVARRLERVAADTNSETIISDALRAASERTFNPVAWEALEEVRLAGRSGTMRVWRHPAGELAVSSKKARSPAAA